jgi:hypothetical protein
MRAQCGLVAANDKYYLEQRLNVPLNHGGARDNKILVTHPMTDQCCLASAIARRAHLPRGHRAPSGLKVGKRNNFVIELVQGYGMPTAQDYRYWDDPSDEFREGMGSLLPLWKFQFDPMRSHAVCDLQWNPHYQDLFAVAYGSCVYTL